MTEQEKHRATINAHNAAADAARGAISDLEEVRKAVFGDVGDEPDVYADYDRCSELAGKMRRAIAALSARRPAQSVTALPDDIVDRVLAVGRVQWGTSHYQSDEKHVEDFRDSLRITREHFKIEAEETAVHYVALEGTATVLANTGISPNSPQHARILTGLWNQLVDFLSEDRS